MEVSLSVIGRLLLKNFQSLPFMVSVTFSPMLIYSIVFADELHVEIRMAILSIVNHLEDSHSDVRQTALKQLSSLAAYGAHYFFFNVDILNCICS